jgi:hypothetical protein
MDPGIRFFPLGSSIGFDEINASYNERGKDLLQVLIGLSNSQSFSDFRMTIEFSWMK